MSWARTFALFVMWVWELPQNLVGEIVRVCTGARLDGRDVYVWRYSSGLSLGSHIFVSQIARGWTIHHEEGHQMQSKILGWFYLPVIGLPSLLHAVWFRTYGCTHGYGYYDFYTEKWANDLAGIDPADKWN